MSSNGTAVTHARQNGAAEVDSYQRMAAAMLWLCFRDIVRGDPKARDSAITWFWEDDAVDNLSFTVCCEALNVAPSNARTRFTAMLQRAPDDLRRHFYRNVLD